LKIKVYSPELKTQIKSLGKVLEFGATTFQSPDIYIEQNVSYNQNEGKPNPALLDLDAWLTFDDVVITDGRVEYLNAKSPIQHTKGLFNGNNFVFNQLNADIKTLNIADDTLQLNINQFNFVERSGFAVNQAKAKVLFKPKHLTFDNLQIKTPNSLLQHRLTFSFKDIDDFSNFENKVKLNGNLQNSRIALKDINYFAALDTISTIAESQLQEVVDISGSISGTVNNLKGKNIQLTLADHTLAEGDFKVRHITDPNLTYLDAQLSQFKSDIDEIIRLAPQINLPDELNNLGAFDFNGNFSGFYNDFVAYGELNTSYGKVISDINLKLEELPVYKGNLIVEDFNLNAFLQKQPNPFGKTSFNVSVSGLGFNKIDLNTDVNGSISNFEYQGKQYQNVYIDGQFSQNQFKGNVNINDPDLNVAFDGIVDLSEEKPQFIIASNLNQINLKQLQLIDDDIIIKTSSKLKIQGVDIDEFTGYINLSDVVLIKDSLEYGFGNVEVVAQQNNNERTVNLKSDILDATISGQFSFKDIHYALQNVLNEYVSYTFLKNKLTTEATYADFSIRIKEPDLVRPFLSLPVDSLQHTEISGSFNSASQQMNVNINLPKLVYDNHSANQIQLNTYTENGQLKVEGSIPEIYTIDSIKVANTQLTGVIKNDTLQFVLNTAQGDAINQILIIGNLAVKNDTISANIDSSKIIINDKLWLAEAGVIKYSNKAAYLLVEGFNLNSDNQYVYVNHKPLKNGNSFTTIKVDSLDMENALAIAGPGKYKFKGILNGEIAIANLLKTPAIVGNFALDDFSYDQFFLGDLRFSANKQPATQKINTTIQLTDTLNQLSASGTIDYSHQKPQLDLEANIQSFSLQILQQIIGDHIYNTRGIISGNASILGDLSNPEFDAELLAIDAGTTLRYTQCDYTADNQVIYVFGRDIYFNDFKLEDQNYYTATVDGFLDLSDLNKIYTDISIFTAGFQFLNTQRRDSDYFFGKAYAEGTVYIEGFLDDIEMNIDVTSKEGTNIKLPLDSDYEETDETFYSFINTGIEKDSTTLRKEKYDVDFSRFGFNANMQITDAAEIQIIFDQQAGDIIKSRGEGELRMEVNTLGDFNIRGNYTIVEGDYLFTLQNIINKKFEIQPGGEISWSGDPFNAQIDIDAQYKRKAVPADLISDVVSNDELANYRKPVNAILNLNMDGVLSKPEVSMSVALENTGVGNFAVESRINEINNDPSQLNRQVVGLLLLNRFLPINGDISVIASDPLQSGVNTLSEYFSNQVSIYLSDALSNVFDDVNVSYQNYDANVNDDNNQDFSNEFQLALGKKFFNDRLYINIGGNLQMSDQQKNLPDVLGGDFLIEYSLTDDGQIKVKAYNKSDYDIFAKYNKSGIGLSYQRSFSDYNTIFKKKK